jgi:hypothetical protein
MSKRDADFLNEWLSIKADLTVARDVLNYHKYENPARDYPDGEQFMYYEIDLSRAGNDLAAILHLAATKAKMGNPYILECAKTDSALQSAIDKVDLI